MRAATALALVLAAGCMPAQLTMTAEMTPYPVYLGPRTRIGSAQPPGPEVPQAAVSYRTDIDSDPHQLRIRSLASDPYWSRNAEAPFYRLHPSTRLDFAILAGTGARPDLFLRLDRLTCEGRTYAFPYGGTSSTMSCALDATAYHRGDPSR